MSQVARDFVESLRSSLCDGTFVGVVLSDARGPRPEGFAKDVRRVDVRKVEIRRGPHLSFVVHDGRTDVTENLAIDLGVERIGAWIGAPFRAVRLRTLAFDLELRVDRSGRIHATHRAPSTTIAPSTAHDHTKTRLAGTLEDAAWLEPLGLVRDGRPRASMEHKLRQIHRYVEILDGLLRHADLLRTADATPVRIVDMGAGKGYLTFALAAHLRRLRVPFVLTGVESRAALAEKGRELAARVGFVELGFRAGQIDDTPLEGADVVIALHACDTATDDALFRAVQANARLIVCAPCCHKELRPRLNAKEAGAVALLSHGILAARQADLLTDTVRALALESAGYRAEVFEFVDAEHTPKNLMIAATRADEAPRLAEKRRARALDQIAALKRDFGFDAQSLERRLGSVREGVPAHEA
jgi:SAM-dependent methyltransferase